MACLWGCSGPPAPSADAGLDAPAISGDAPASALAEGVYRLDWTCIEGCAAGLPAASFDRLEVTEIALRYWYQECPSCDASDIITQRDDRCLSGAGIPQGDGASPTDPYSFCAGGEIAAIVRYRGYPGPPELRRVWRVTAGAL